MDTVLETPLANEAWLDARGLHCPEPVMMLHKRVRELASGAILGLIIGSFIAAVTVRMPRDEDIVFTRSHCMSCEAPLKAWHLVPVVSWLVQRGRCAMCGAARIMKRRFTPACADAAPMRI